MQIAFMVQLNRHLASYPRRFASLLGELKGLNARVSDLEALLGTRQSCSIPPHLEVDFSTKCNLRCPMCHQSKLDMGKFELGAHTIDTLIDSLPQRDTVMIAGLGEPLLYPGLDTFLLHTAHYQCRTHLFTNGQLIHRKIDVLRHVDRISVSMDGATRATFETLRRGAQFATVCRNIGLLRKAAPSSVLVTSTVISRLNVGEAAAIILLAESLGMDEVHLSPVDHTETLALRPQDWTVFQQQLEGVKTRRTRVVNNLQSRHFAAGRDSHVSSLDHQLAENVATPVPPAEAWPQPPPLLPTQGTGIHHLPAAVQLEVLARRISALDVQRKVLLGMLPEAQPRIPYCSAPWKYGFAQSNGLARLCPYADFAIGAASDVLGREYNSPMLEQVRHGMRGNAPMLSVCQGCTDAHRQFRHDTLKRTLAECLKPAPRFHGWIRNRLRGHRPRKIYP
jgi:MoaA/NifB/PqqE/SkfB family radical SAM enzyme